MSDRRNLPAAKVAAWNWSSSSVLSSASDARDGRGAGEALTRQENTTTRSARFSLWRSVMRRCWIVAAVIGALIATDLTAVASAQDQAGGPKRPAVLFLTDASSTLVKLEPLLRSGDAVVVVVDQSASMRPGGRLPDAILK